MATSKRKLFLWISGLLLICCLGVISYYALYHSEKMDSGLIEPVYIFRGHASLLRAVRFSTNGEFLATASVDSTVQVWKKNGELLRVLKHPSAIASMDMDSSQIVTGGYDGMVRLWSHEGVLIHTFSTPDKTVWTVDLSADGKWLAAGSDGGKVYAWHIEERRLLHAIPAHSLTVWSVKFMPGSALLASSSFDTGIRLWNLQDGSLVKTISGHSEAVVDIAFNRDGKLLASTSDDKTIRFWSMPAGKLIRTLNVAEHVQAAAFSPDDQFLLTAGRDKPAMGEFFQEVLGDNLVNQGVSMRLWEVKSGRLIHTFTEHNNDVNDVAWSPDGKWFASASEDKTVRLWKFKK